MMNVKLIKTKKKNIERSFFDIGQHLILCIQIVTYMGRMYYRPCTKRLVAEVHVSAFNLLS